MINKLSEENIGADAIRALSVEELNAVSGGDKALTGCKVIGKAAGGGVIVWCPDPPPPPPPPTIV